MKRFFKNIIKWFDWSNYAVNGDIYKLPDSYTIMVLRTLFGILVLPFTYILHIINLLYKPNYNGVNNKLDFMNGVLYYVFSLIVGSLLVVKIDDIFLTDFYTSNGFFINSFLFSLIGFVVIVLCLIIISILIVLYKKYIKGKDKINWD